MELGKRLYVIGGLTVAYAVFVGLLLTIPFWREKPSDRH